MSELLGQKLQKNIATFLGMGKPFFEKFYLTKSDHVFQIRNLGILQ